jgi:hypothetical protein
LQFPKVKKSIWIKYGIGIGLGLFAIDHYPVNLIGLLILFVFTVLYTKDMDWKTLDWGSKWVYIPMFAILGTTLLRLAIYHTINEFFAVSFFAIAIILYLISRQMGKEIIKVLIPFLIVEITCIIIMALINRGEITSGFIGQYNRAVGFMVYIAILSKGKWQWLLVVFSVIAIVLTGSLEGLIILAILGIMILAKRDFSKKLWIPMGIIAIPLLVLAVSGYFPILYSQGIEHLHLNDSTLELSQALNGRVIVYRESIHNLSILGHGYTNSLFNNSTVHNVPLIIFDQLGIVAGLAWITITGYCLLKTKWKYAWMMIITMCIFDHFVWTGLAPFFWVAVGMTTRTKENDYIFRSVNGKLLGNSG